DLGLLGDAGLGVPRLCRQPASCARDFGGAAISDLDTLVNAPFDGRLVTIFIVTANPIMIAIIVFAVLAARAPLADYLAVGVPPRRDVGIGLVCLVGLIAISDALLYFGGFPVVTPFQVQSYTTAAAQ